MSVILSILVPVYGVERYIEQCAHSLFTQSLRDNIEFIFVNDCTKDKSIQIIEKVLQQYPHRKNQVKIVHHAKNQGLAAARLTGLKNASGLYIAHCDSDDWVEPNMYELLCEKALANDSDVVACNFYKDINGTSIPIMINYNNREDYLKGVIGNEWGTVWRYISKRNLFTSGKIQIVPEICYGEDYIYSVQTLLAAKNFSYVSSPIYHHNCSNQDSMMKNVSLNAALEQKAASDFIFKILHDCQKQVEYSKEIIKRKLYSRNQFLGSGIKHWREVYPEIKNSYWHLQDLSFIKKIIYFSLENLPIILLNYCLNSRFFKRFIIR